MIKKRKLLTTIGMCLLFLQMYAQKASTSGGGDAFGNNGNVSYSIGQMAFSASTGSNGSVNPGVQQPYEIYVKTGFDVIGINLNLSAYPNPTTDVLTLKVDDFNKNMEYQLYNESGKLLLNKEVIGTITNIPMSGYTNAIYILKVNQNHKQIKTFKIVKN